MLKRILILSLIMLLTFVGTTFAYNLGNVSTLSTSNIHKAPYSGLENKPDPNVILQGGDTFATAVNIPSLPYSNIGTTVGFTDDYDVICPYVAPGSPDVVYSYTPIFNETMDITLCGNTNYDSKLYVVNENMNVIACNDDECSTPSYLGPYVSQIPALALTGGNTYYIVVDGYGGYAGNYTIDVTVAIPCIVDCPPGSTVEGEPICHNNYVDTYNGGCNSTPNVFQTIQCDEYICGTSGTYQMSGQNYRDTDWFELIVTEDCNLTWSGVADFPLLMFIIDAGSVNCADYSVLTYGYADPCDTLYLNYAATPGTYWLWIGPSIFGIGAPCPAEYVAWVNCYNESAVIDNQIDLPAEYALTGSYPNPFNTSTIITYETPIFGDVNLEVYNLMGQKVVTLVNGSVEAGQHSVTWDAAHNSSGIYFYKLAAGDKVFINRMTLLK